MTATRDDAVLAAEEGDAMPERMRAALSKEAQQCILQGYTDYNAAIASRNRVCDKEECHRG